MSPAPPERLGLRRHDVRFLSVLGGLVGGALGAASPFLLGWIGELRWIPFRWAVELLDSFDPAWFWVRPVVGAALGLALVAYLVHVSPVLVVDETHIEVSQRGVVRRIRREQVGGIFRDGRVVVVESAQGRELFRGEVEGARSAVREAFVARGYPWEAE